MGCDFVCNSHRVDRDVRARLKPRLPLVVRFAGLRASGRLVEMFVDLPLDLCRRRGPKGPYAGADRAELRQLTGIDSVYEPRRVARDAHTGERSGSRRGGQATARSPVAVSRNAGRVRACRGLDVRDPAWPA